MNNSAVSAEDIARGVNEIPLGVFFSGVLLDKSAVIAVLHKADILAVMLARIDKSLRLGDTSHLRLRHPA